MQFQYSVSGGLVPRELGFDSWPQLKSHIETLGSTPVNLHELVTRDAHVNARDNHGRTALIEACHGGPWKPQPAEEIIQLLLNNNAQIDLFTAAALGRTEVIQALLDQDGTLINGLNDESKTALFLAACNNCFAAVRLLVELGAEVNRSDAVGIAALHRTSQQCSDELIQYLIDHGADAHLCCYVACGDETICWRQVY